MTKRETIDTGTDKRYLRRDEKGQFKESVDVGKSLSADRRHKPKPRPSRAKATVATVATGIPSTDAVPPLDEGMGDDTEPETMESDDGDERVAFSFPFDRMTVQRFRQEFPRARWSDRRKAWLVPGKTALRRFDRWRAKEDSRADPFAEEKGRDAFAFEPILSPYLSVDKDGFRIRTPYSRKIVEEIRQVPFSRWDGDHKVWRVPFASYDELVHHWQAIEGEAQRCEPEERRKRAEARKGAEDERRARRRTAERRRRRIPLPADDLPPLERPIATEVYGIIVVSDITGELFEHEEVADLYPDISDDQIWGSWRVPSLEELVQTWPSKAAARDDERRRGWWFPTIEELRDARRAARSRERRTAQQIET